MNVEFLVFVKKQVFLRSALIGQELLLRKCYKLQFYFVFCSVSSFSSLYFFFFVFSVFLYISGVPPQYAQFFHQIDKRRWILFLLSIQIRWIFFNFAPIEHHTEFFAFSPRLPDEFRELFSFVVVVVVACDSFADNKQHEFYLQNELPPTVNWPTNMLTAVNRNYTVYYYSI